MEKDKGNMNARKRKTIDGGCKLSFRLNAEEKARFDRMMAETEARDRTLLIKKSLFGGTLRVVKTDKVTLDYYVRLTDLYKQFQAVGNNYNQTVKAVKKNFDEKRIRAYCKSGTITGTSSNRPLERCIWRQTRQRTMRRRLSADA